MLQSKDLVFGTPGLEEVGIYRVGQDVYLLRSAIELLAQQSGGMLGTDEDDMG